MGEPVLWDHGGTQRNFFELSQYRFSTNIRVTAELPQGVARDTVFWWIVGGIQNLPLQISGLALPASSRLHLHKLVNRNVEPLDEFDLCQVAGAGMVFQVTMAAKSTSFDFMEGQMRAYLGHEAKEPQFLSSGLEDYFLGTYYFNRGLYHLPQAGLTHRDDSKFCVLGLPLPRSGSNPVSTGNSFGMPMR